MSFAVSFARCSTALVYWAHRGGSGEGEERVRRFKLPLIVTGLALLFAVVVGLLVVTSIHRSAGSRAEKEERAQKAGGAVAVGVCLVVAPFWLYAGAKVGKERREARGRGGRGFRQR